MNRLRPQRTRAPSATRERLAPLLAVIDEGLSLYRRHFLSFVLLSAIWFVPAAILVGLVVAFFNTGPLVLLFFGLALLLFPLMIYLIGALSRAAVAALEERPICLREALAIRPLRLFSMSIFTVVYYALAQITTSMVSMVCICPAYIVGVMLVTGAASVSDTVGVAVLLVITIVFGIIYIVALMIGGAAFSSLVYAIQPWVQDARPFGEAVQQSLDLTVYHFRRNCVVWGVAALLLAAVSIAVTTTIGVALPLPLIYLLGDQSPVTQAVSASAWLIGLCLALPPLPIWMALWYRRNQAARSGTDFEAKVQVWLKTEVRS